MERYAALTELLHELASEKVDFVRWEEHQGAFDDLGEALTTPPILAYPDPESPFILDTDDSDKTISAELSQIQKDKVATICYASKVLTPAQRKYCTTRKELLAIVAFTRQFRHYLLGNHFILRTDHKSLKWIMNLRNNEGQLTRWLEELSQYNMSIQHRPGNKHINADALSRIPDREEQCCHYKASIPLENLPCGGCR